MLDDPREKGWEGRESSFGEFCLWVSALVVGWIAGGWLYDLFR